MKKGFTLIELLAVIVILAVIALITTPLILNTIEKAEKGAFQDSVYGIMDGAELSIATKELALPVTFTYPEVEGYPTIDLKGKKPSDGYIEVGKEGKMKVFLTDGKWCAQKEGADANLIITKGKCLMESDPQMFSVNATGEEIIKYLGSETDIVIPAKINGIVITSIKSSTFYNKKLTSVVLPKGLKKIGASAFYQNQLTSITLPSTVEQVDANAFRNNKLTNITFSTSLKTIGMAAFTDNEMPDEEAFIYNRKSDVTEDKTALNSYAGKRTTGITIPSTITKIESAAFSECGITDILLPSTIQKIDSSAFSVNKLTTITIPSSVTYLWTSAFQSNQLTSVKIMGKASSSAFASYGTNIWGWAPGYNDSNIVWNAS